MHKARLLAALIVSAAVLAGCTRSVVLDGSYSREVPRQGDFGNILVLGLSPHVNQRCRFEQSLAASLRSEGIKATMSCNLMDAREPITREAVEKAVATLDADAVIVTSLIATDAKAKEGASGDARGSRFFKATDVGYEAWGYGNWGTYGVPVVYGEFETAPSIFTIKGTARLTTRVYATAGAALIYTLDTKAKDLSSREIALARISPAIVHRLKREGLVR